MPTPFSGETTSSSSSTTSTTTSTSSVDLTDLQENYSVSLADLEDLIASGSITTSSSTSSSSSSTENLLDMSSTYGGTGTDSYRRAGSFLTSDTIKEYLTYVLDESYRYAGMGTHNNMMQNFLSRLDRHGTALVPLNTMNYGYTFITRPRLNLTGANLVQNPVLNTLYANNGNSVAFMIRALLDTRLCKGESLFRAVNTSYSGITEELTDFVAQVEASGLVDRYNPFFTPLCNGLKGISGFPDFTIETETTEGDFHSGDFTFAKGGDMMNRTQELSLEFRDVNGSIILSCIYYWLIYIALQCVGVVMAYPDDIYEQRLNYTVSIYRFITDPSRKHVLWWAKATGCFPKAAPVGALFNVNQGEVTLSSAGNFSVPFVANKVEINDPGILMDFNKLMTNYCPLIASDTTYPVLDDSLTSPTAGVNFAGLPYLKTDSTDGIQLVWKTSSSYLSTLGIDKITNDVVDNSSTWSSKYQSAISSRASSISAAYSALTSTYTSATSSTSSSDSDESSTAISVTGAAAANMTSTSSSSSSS